MKAALLIGTALGLLSSGAFAADLPMTKTVPLPEQAEGSDLVGLLTLSGFGFNGWDTFSNGDSYSERGAGAYAAGDVALAVSPQFSIQAGIGDVYDFSRQDNLGQPSWQFNRPGGNLHLSWHPNADADLVGVVGSIGQTAYTPLDNNSDSPYTATWLNGGIEGALYKDNWRFYGQLGEAGLLNGGTADLAGTMTTYGALAATYFFTPNLAASGTVSGNAYHDASGTGTSARVSARLEWRPDNSPVAYYASYGLGAASSNYTAIYRPGQSSHGGGQSLEVGMHIPFGVSTVEDGFKSIGLQDFNPYF